MAAKGNKICYVLIELSFASARIQVAFTLHAPFTNFIRLALQIFLKVRWHVQISFTCAICHTCNFAHEKD